MKGGEHMTIYERLNDETRHKLNAIKPAVHRQPVRSKEKLSEREWREVMGMNRQTYTRRNGAIRSKGR